MTAKTRDTVVLIGGGEALAAPLRAIASVRLAATLVEVDGASCVVVARAIAETDLIALCRRSAVVLVTSEPTVVGAALGAGVWDVLVEPVSPALLRHKVEQALDQGRLADAADGAREELKAILGHAADGILTVSEAGHIRSFNAAAEAIFGWTAAEVIGRDVSCLMPADIGTRHGAFMQGYLRGADSRIVGIGREVLGQRKDGTVFPLHLAVSDVIVRGRRIFTGIASDLTALRAAQARAEEREALLSAVLNDTPDPIFAKDTEGRYLIANEAFCDVLGFSLDDVLGRSNRDLFPDREENLGSVDREVLSGQGACVVQERLVTGGESHTFVVTKSALRDGDGRIVGMVGVARDITGLLRTQRELKERNRLLALTEEVAGVGHWYMDAATKALSWSPETYRIHGLDPSRPVPSLEDVADFYVTEDLPKVRDAIDTALEAHREIRLEARLRRGDDDIRDIILHVVPDFDGGGDLRGLLGILHDITDLRRAQTRAEVVSEMLNQSVGALRDAFVLFDADERLILCNDAYSTLLGGGIHAGMTFEEVLRQGLSQGRFTKAVGREEEWFAERLAGFRKGGAGEILVDGRWFLSSDQYLANGYVVGTRVDVTDLRHAREEADRANRAKSDFLSSMSHELRTPLNAILGFAQLLAHSRKEPLSDRQAAQVGHILAGGKHLLNLINDVLDLARVETGKILLSLEPLETRGLLDDCLMLTRRLGEATGITVIDGTGGMALPSLFVDQTRAKQVLLNLLSNAVKYNRPNGTVRLSAQADSDGRLRLSVTDTGYGIPADRRGELFQPFSRLGQELGEIEGTGIGLTITRKLATEMGGDVGVSSEEGVGSTFWVSLPTTNGHAHVVTVGDEGGSRAFRTGGLDGAGDGALRHVLYVEDNRANRALMAQAMEDVDYIRLTMAATAEDGLRLALEERPDVILMDINLPGMDGFEALSVLRDRPRTRAIPVIALTANAMLETLGRGRAAGFAAYLTKPVHQSDLHRVLRDVVHGVTLPESVDTGDTGDEGDEAESLRAGE